MRALLALLLVGCSGAMEAPQETAVTYRDSALYVTVAEPSYVFLEALTMVSEPVALPSPSLSVGGETSWAHRNRLGGSLERYWLTVATADQVDELRVSPVALEPQRIFLGINADSFDLCQVEPGTWKLCP